MRAEVMATLCFALAAGCKSSPRQPVKQPAVPAIPARSSLGWRCPAGAAACIDRADLAAPFACNGNRCVQVHPVLPDDGEWTCGESAGVTLCTGGESAAGVAPVGLGPGWMCGPRRGKPSERVCRDDAPDFPDGKPSGWRCFYGGPALPQRICGRDASNHVIGDACDDRHPCVDGAGCRAGVCVVPRRAPTCWLDADCGSGPCRLGNCATDPTLPDALSPAPAPPGPALSLPVTTLDFGPAQPQLGFDTEFTITVKVASGPRPRRITWRPTGRLPVVGLQASEDGFRVTGRTPAWQTALGTDEPPWGVVPISPRTRGEVNLEASWNAAGGKAERRTVNLAAAASARGLTTVPIGARLYLGGQGWRILRGPDGSQAALEDHDGLTGFLPDLAGVWRLRDGRGRDLDLIAGRYEDVPLDCSRAACHAEMLAGSLASPMTTVMARLLDGFPKTGPQLDQAGDYPGCALACHATGQPDVADGGFHDVALALKRTGQEHARWPNLPRVLRRLGGAGCLSCHGPGAIPDPRSSWATLRSEVCAVCHDDPPVYTHVTAWRSSANSRADRDPDAAGKPECVRCHTTWGFLLAEKPQQAKNAAARASHDHLTFMASLRPPAQAGPIGIACAACHDSHPPVDGFGKTPHALVRKVAHPALLPALPAETAGRSEICLPCHTPDRERRTVPFASAAALWLGRGGLDPVTGNAIEGPAPLADLAGGCLQCHRGDGTRGGNHSFACRWQDCPDCGRQDPRRPGGVFRRARQLYLDAKLYRALGDVRPLHASKATIRLDTRAGRALWNLLLLLEDRAAEVHNPPYAQALLESAEAVLRPGTTLRELIGGRR